MPKVAVVQDSPVFFNKSKTIDKIEAIVEKESAYGSELIVFPESFVPGYPRGFSFGTMVGSREDQGRELYARYYNESLDLESEDMQRLVEISQKAKAYLVIGATEKTSASGSLYCSMIYISPKSGLMGVHRKIKPTGQERVIWAESDGTDLVTFDTPIGRLGGLICWENYMPLARMAMYRQGVNVYIAPTADSRSNWLASMQHIALEGRCYVLACNQYFTKSMYPENLQSQLSSAKEDICPGGSVIVAPSGEIIAGPIYGETGVVRADLDLEQVTKMKLDFDPIGHYDRSDIFHLEVNGQPPIVKKD